MRGPGNAMLAERFAPDLGDRMGHFPRHNLGISLLNVKVGRGIYHRFHGRLKAMNVADPRFQSGLPSWLRVYVKHR